MEFAGVEMLGGACNTSLSRRWYIQPCQPLLHIPPIAATAAQAPRTAGTRVHTRAVLLHDLRPVYLVRDAVVCGQERADDEPATCCDDLW
jgi:hypothetical protein